MPNAPLMGIGGPGVRENKTVSESTEVKLPFMQFVGIWFVGILISFFGYLVIKMFITDRGDWSLLIGILTPIALIAGGVFFERRIAKRFFPNVWRDFLNWNKRILDGDNFGPIFLYFFAVSILILVGAGFYIYIIVPQLTALFDQRAHYVFVLCAFASLLIAARPYFVFNKRQLTDSLRDSDSRYAIRSLELEYERRYRQEDYERSLENEVVDNQPSDESALRHGIIVKASEKALPEPNDADVRIKDMIMDFLEGMDRGLWGTGERSWRNVNGRAKILPRTGHHLFSVGGDIRDKLIAGGWASWKNPDDHSAGWTVDYDTDFIERNAFNDDNRVRSATGVSRSQNGEALAGAYEVFMADDESDDHGEGDSN